MFEIKQELNGWVKVSIYVGGQWSSDLWKMTVEEATAEAEEIIRRKAA